MKRALITGVTGQDGSYLAEHLLSQGYEVFGLMRRTSAGPPPVFEEAHMVKGVQLLYGDLRDLSSVKRALDISKPDEIYNLAAQSHVGISFDCPEEVWEINYHGLGRVVIEAKAQNPQVRIYQASTSEMFGTTPPPQHETSGFNPVSPYAEAKLRAHRDYVVNYRERDGLFICSGILFNHESPRRGKHFVTRKITHSLVKIKLGLQDVLELGNLSALRDWGDARDYVKIMHRMLQNEVPTDYVIATGTQHSVRDFAIAAASVLGMKLTFEGEGENEVARDQDGRIIIRVNPKFYRPREVQNLLGDPSKAKRELNFTLSIPFETMVRDMVEADFELVSKHHAPVQPLNASS